MGIVTEYFRNHSVWKLNIRGWLHQLDRRISDLAAEVHRGFGELRGDIAVIKAEISGDGR